MSLHYDRCGNARQAIGAKGPTVGLVVHLRESVDGARRQDDGVETLVTGRAVSMAGDAVGVLQSLDQRALAILRDFDHTVGDFDDRRTGPAGERDGERQYQK